MSYMNSTLLLVVIEEGESVDAAPKETYSHKYYYRKSGNSLSAGAIIAIIAAIVVVCIIIGLLLILRKKTFTIGKETYPIESYDTNMNLRDPNVK